MKKLIFVLVFCLMSTVLSTPAAHANAITFTINNPVQGAGPAGGTLQFQATVAAPSSNSGLIYLNADSFSLAAPLTLDDTPYLLNFPFYLNPGGTFSDTLFDVIIPANISVGIYAGSFEILGGATDNDQLVLGSANFDINVTPEPSSLFLLGTGLLSMVAMNRWCSLPRFASRRKVDA
jgi:hypothetical protein